MDAAECCVFVVHHGALPLSVRGEFKPSGEERGPLEVFPAETCCVPQQAVL